MATLFNNVANTNTVNYVPVQATFSASGSFLTFIGPGGVPFTAGGSLSINSTSITGGTSGRILFDNAGTVGEKTVTGTGNVVLSASPTLSGTVNLSSLTASQAVFTDASKNLVSVATTGIGSVVLNNASDPSIAYLPTILSNLVINGTYAGATPGTNSTVFGHSIAATNNYGDSNTVIGYQALENDTSLGSNTVVGTYAFKNYVAGPDGDGSNTIIGANCFQLAQTSDFTTAIGAGMVFGSGVFGTRSSTYVGAGIQAKGNNEIVIGANIVGKGDNTTLIGNAQSVTYFPTTVITGTYTVATLPNSTATGRVVGARAFVTNALTPAFGATAVGGGAVGVPVYYDGTTWKVG